MISVLVLAFIALLFAAAASAVLTLAKPVQDRRATLATAHYLANNWPPIQSEIAYAAL
jgi:hypothetical protein